MKQLVAIVCVGFLGNFQAQTTSRDVEIFERYENGELVEQRQSATENGEPIENFDFEQAKRDMEMKTGDLEKRMEEMRQESVQRMEEMKQQMDQKTQEFEKRTQEMQQQMKLKMKEMDSNGNQIKDSKTIEKKPMPTENQGVGASAEQLKFS